MLYNSRELYNSSFYGIIRFMKRWTQIFKALGNINRLKIIKFLEGGAAMTVGDISHELEISCTYKANCKLACFPCQGHIHYHHDINHE